jgi:hypothetical protein
MKRPRGRERRSCETVDEKAMLRDEEAVRQGMEKATRLRDEEAVRQGMKRL